jgi:4-amino-4-deoxy-L-arabinose transferase-like glycosyltransferase
VGAGQHQCGQSDRLPVTFLKAISERVRLERVLGPISRMTLRDEVLLGLVAAVIVFPLISIRAYHYEEGLTAALARDALSDSPWYVPDLFGARWIERPVMQSWIAAAMSWLLGGVSQITVRLPTVAALFAGTLLIWALVRPRVSRSAALVAALCFLFSPAVLQKAVTAEADILLSAFQFAAFVVWWHGYEAGRISFARWLAVGLLLAATALCKGPQPAAFFALGVGAFILIRRDWKQLPGYVLAGAVSVGIMASWSIAVYRAADIDTLLEYMRLSRKETIFDYLAYRLGFMTVLVAFLPGLLIAAPALIDWARRREPADISAADRSLFLALVLYATIPILALAVWPGAAARYAMPALLAIAALAGLCLDRLITRRVDLARLALSILAGLMAYQFIWGWIVAPLLADTFARTRIEARVVEAATRAKPYTIFALLRLDDAVLAYLDRPVRYLEGKQLMALPAPAYLLAEPQTADMIGKARPELTIVLHATINNKSLGLYELVPR